MKNKTINKIIEYVKEHSKIIVSLITKKPFWLINDKLYLKMLYRVRMGRKLNLDNPVTFNEKLQWLKIYDRKPEYTNMVDKYEVKEYIKKEIGAEYIISTIGVYEKFEDIDFDKLPDKFVIKCTHDSGGNVICRNKNEFDIKSARKKINKSLKKNYFYSGREWPYKNIKPRIIIEKYMEDFNNESIRDYKFFCFNGVVKFLYISDDSHTSNQKIAFFDSDFEYMNIKRKDYKDYNILPNKPKNFVLMKKLASKLSKDIPHVRVDFYEIKNKVYFGELTLYTGSGFIPFEDIEWDYKLGKMLDLTSLKLGKVKKK